MNVLLTTADQHLATCLGHEHHPQVITPQLDRLAAAAVRFGHAYTQSPICTPSRVSIYSGQYCHNHGYFGLSGPTPLRLPSFLSHFKAHGYRTGATGNLHTPNHPRNWLADHLDYFDDTFESIEGTGGMLKPPRTASQPAPSAGDAELRRRGLEEQEENCWSG